MRLIIGYFVFVCVLVIGLAGVGTPANAEEGEAAGELAQDAGGLA